MVRNLKDGRVEVYVEGTEQAVAGLYNDLLGGPTYSRVDNIEELVEDVRGEYKSFRIER